MRTWPRFQVGKEAKRRSFGGCVRSETDPRFEAGRSWGSEISKLDVKFYGENEIQEKKKLLKLGNLMKP